MDYNIHWVLWDLFKIKSKWLCKHNKHLYMIRGDYKIFEEKTNEEGIEIVKKHKVWLPPYYKCYCCGEEVRVD